MIEEARWRRVASMTWDDVLADITGDEVRDSVLGTMRRLEADPQFTPIIVDLVERRVPEIRTAVSWLARELQPRTYLEIGVRRGFSMAQAVTRVPDLRVWGFDMWVTNYAGSENPGPTFVQDQLRALGYTGRLDLVSGDSHKTLPAFFGNRPAPLPQRIGMGGLRRSRPEEFDMVIVDGDHSLLGADQDLKDVIPHVAPGGVLVFDDISPDPERDGIAGELGADPHGWGDLDGLWTHVMDEHPGFTHFEFGGEYHPGVAFAIRTA